MYLAVLHRASTSCLDRVDRGGWSADKDLLLLPILARPDDNLLAGEAGELLGRQPDLALNWSAGGRTHHQLLLVTRPGVTGVTQVMMMAGRT